MKRFIDVQKRDFDLALKEIKNGMKESHYMWYIFPQLKGLGSNYYATYYGISSLDEAKEYCNNEYLYNNLIEITFALLDLKSNDALEILGFPDNLKLQSSMTLFYIATNNELFKRVLDKFFDGKEDIKTINLIKK